MAKCDRRVVVLVALIIILFALFTIFLLLYLTKNCEVNSENVPNTEPSSKSTSETFRFAAVASDGRPCSSIGTKIMAEHGGSAVDATIATMICIGVVNPQSSGLGGGHFMTIYDTPSGGSQKVFETISARETAPQAATEQMFDAEPEKAKYGGLAIAVPGEVHGFYTAWERYGKVPWAMLFEDSIRLCEDGFLASEHLVQGLEYARSMGLNLSNPIWSELFGPEENPVVEGGRIVNTRLAATLRKIAAGPLDFYNPSTSLGRDVLDDILEAGGIITESDMQMYASRLREPLQTHLRNGNYTIYLPRPPSSGAVLGYILKILDGYNFVKDSISSADNKVLTYHRIVEAFKFAYAKRAELGDEDFVDVTSHIADMTGDDVPEAVRNAINDDATKSSPSDYNATFYTITDGGTSHCSVLAPDGAAVAVTSTINLPLGSHVRGRRTGIIFNDDMEDFSKNQTDDTSRLMPSPFNLIEPRKMPFSSMTPCLIVDGSGRVMVIGGASGGPFITTTTAQIIMRTLWFGQDITTATDEPRIHHQLAPEELKVESEFEQSVAEGLEKKGHVVLSEFNRTVAQTIHRQCYRDELRMNGNCLNAVTDFRKKSGKPDGY